VKSMSRSMQVYGILLLSRCAVDAQRPSRKGGVAEVMGVFSSLLLHVVGDARTQGFIPRHHSYWETQS
jgi:hypothetical protein